MASNYELGVQKHCFGEFWCADCGRGWESSKAWRDYGQECVNCNSKIIPHRLLPLFFYYCAECECVWRHKWVEEGVECKSCGETVEGYVQFQKFWKPRRLSASSGSGVIDQERAHQQDKCEKCILLGNGRLCYQSDAVNIKNPHIPFQMSNGQTAHLKPTKVKTFPISKVRESNMTMKVKRVEANCKNPDNMVYNSGSGSQSNSSLNGTWNLGQINIVKPLTFEEQQEEQAKINAAKKQQRDAKKQQMEIQEKKRQEERRVAEELKLMKAEENRRQLEIKRLQQQKETEQRHQKRLEKLRLEKEDEERRKAEERQREVELRRQQREDEETRQQNEIEQRQIRQAQEIRQRNEGEQRRRIQADAEVIRRRNEDEQRRRRQVEQARQRNEDEQRRQRQAEQTRRRDEYFQRGDRNVNAGGINLAAVGAVALIGISILRLYFRL